MKLKYAPYSNSKINLFYECPNRWHLQYIQKVRISKPTHYFEKGNFYHYVLEHFPNLPEKKFKFQFADEAKQAEFVANIKEFIKLPEVHDLLTKHSLKREETCGLNESWQYEARRKASMFTGYIDYLGQENPGEIIVADWKSSMNYEPKFFQLQLYALWCFMVMPHIDKVKAGFCYVEDKELKWTYFEREKDAEDLKLLFINKIRKIEECNEFKKQPSKACDRCEYFGEHCKPFNVKVPGVTNG